MKIKQLLSSLSLLVLMGYCAYTFIPAFISTLTYRATSTDKQSLQAFNNIQSIFSIIFGLVSIAILAVIIFSLYMLVDSFHKSEAKS
jgi:cell division protein FtsB